MDNLTPKQLNLLKRAQEAHAHQSRSKGQIPYWHHVQSVMEIVQNAFEASRELQHEPALYEDVLLAAIGHDFYEDTKVTSEEIRTNYGNRVDGLIQELTNEDGDDNRDRYVQKIKQAPEEVKLIKIADLTENTLSVAYSLHDLGLEWAHSFYLPIVEEMSPIVTSAIYKRYPTTASILLDHMNFAFQRLYENIQKYK
jgi:(p)ppGpp synthase/HD superfamily hydrolase